MNISEEVRPGANRYVSGQGIFARFRKLSCVF